MRRIIAIIAALAILAGLVALFRTAQRFDVASGRAGDYRDAGMGDISIRFENATIVARERGVTRWSVHADRMDLRRPPGGDLESYTTADFAGLKNGLLYRDGKPEATFSAREASFDQSTQRFDVRGGIRLRSARGDTLQTEQCLWSEREDFVRLPKGGRGVFRGHPISAPSLLFSPRQRLVQCPQGAEGAFEGYRLRASALFWDVDKDTVNCPGPVSGQRSNADFTAQNADIDLKAHRLKANNGIVHLRITGEDGL